MQSFDNVMTDGFSNKKKEIYFFSFNLQVPFKFNITVCYLNLHFPGPEQWIFVHWREKKQKNKSFLLFPVTYALRFSAFGLYFVCLDFEGIHGVEQNAWDLKWDWQGHWNRNSATVFVSSFLGK